MASQIPPNAPPACMARDTTSTEATPPIVELARHDTSSSTGSALRPPHGNWALNISGVCSKCNHYNSSLQVHVRISDDSTQSGDIYCKRCRGLWEVFGKNNATRLSLLSAISMEPDPIEAEFRGTLVQMIRSTMPVAVLSATLTVIPESAGPSRGTSVRSAARSDPQNPAATVINDTPPTADETEDGHKHSNNRKRIKLSKHTWGKGRKILIRVQHKAKAGFSRLQGFPFGLGRWFSKESPEYGSHQQEPTRPSSRVSPTMVVTPSLPEEEPQTQAEADTTFDATALDVCASSTTTVDALAALKALNPQALQALPPQQRIAWGRQQLTHFKACHTATTATPATIHSESLTDRTEILPTVDYPPFRRHSVHSLAYVGHAFDTRDNWSIYRDSSRPFSISETNLSDTDTLVDGVSVSSSPRHILIESLHRNPRRSLSPRPLSMQSAIQDWAHVRRNRAEARRSIDSTATGGAVRSITAHNRLSRTSMHRASSVYGVDPASSQVQVRIDEESDGSQRPRSPSPSRLDPGIDTARE